MGLQAKVDDVRAIEWRAILPGTWGLTTSSSSESYTNYVEEEEKKRERVRGRETRKGRKDKVGRFVRKGVEKKRRLLEGIARYLHLRTGRIEPHCVDCCLPHFRAPSSRKNRKVGGIRCEARKSGPGTGTFRFFSNPGPLDPESYALPLRP